MLYKRLKGVSPIMLPCENYAASIPSRGSSIQGSYFKVQTVPLKNATLARTFSLSARIKLIAVLIENAFLL